MRQPGEAPDPVDAYVGVAIRAGRKRLSVSQQDLADAAGVTFQQIQKYENGANRVSASMLHRIATRLQAPIAAFFPPADERQLEISGVAHRLAGAVGGIVLAESYLSLRPDARDSLLSVAKALRGLGAVQAAHDRQFETEAAPKSLADISYGG